MTENDLNPELETDALVDQPELSDDRADEIDEAELDMSEIDDADDSADVINETRLPSFGTDSLGSDSLGDDWTIGGIDAALAAVASFNEIVPEREAEAEARADAAHTAPAFVPAMQMPPLTTLKRGQLGSIVPALLLIGVGAWLTLLTTTGASPDPLLLVLVVVGGIVLSLLAQWVGTGRWSRGVFLFALMVLLIAGAVAGINAFAVQSGGIDLVQGYPLLVTALGLAFLLDGILARPSNTRLIAPGVLLIVAGVVGLVVTLGLIPANILTFAAPLLPVVLVVAVVLVLLPLVFRRR